MIRESISKVVGGEDLTEAEMEKAMDEIMTGTATPAQIGAFITALRLKGETVDEITGAARTMRAKATKICVNNNMVNLTTEMRIGAIYPTFLESSKTSSSNAMRRPSDNIAATAITICGCLTCSAGKMNSNNQPQLMISSACWKKR